MVTNWVYIDEGSFVAWRTRDGGLVFPYLHTHLTSYNYVTIRSVDMMLEALWKVNILVP